MNRILCLLPLVAVAFAQPMLHDEDEASLGNEGGPWGRSLRSADKMAAPSAAVWTAETKMAAPAGWNTNSQMRTSGRSLWSADNKMAAPSAAVWTAETKMAAPAEWNTNSQMRTSGRSLWSADNKMVAPSAWTAESKMAAPASWNADAKMVGSGRSLWSAERMVAPSARSSWEASSAHLHKDAQPHSEILAQEFEMPEPGNYQYSFKTADGIEAHEQAAMKSADAEAVQGVYSWIAPSGEKFSVEYVADETGYHAKGAHIPQIPRDIARSLEWNAAHPEEEKESAAGAASWEHPSAHAGSAGSARSAWESESHMPAWKSESHMPARMGAARSAWVADSSAALPSFGSFGSGAKTESSARHSAGMWSAQPASWESQSAFPAKMGQITETSYSGILPTGRSAWSSDSLSGLGASNTARFTETRTMGTPTTFSASSHF